MPRLFLPTPSNETKSKTHASPAMLAHASHKSYGNCFDQRQPVHSFIKAFKNLGCRVRFATPVPSMAALAIRRAWAHGAFRRYSISATGQVCNTQQHHTPRARTEEGCQVMNSNKAKGYSGLTHHLSLAYTGLRLRQPDLSDSRRDGCI